MPIYAYEAVSATGKKISGTHRAATKTAAIQELRERGYSIRSVQEKPAGLMDKEITIGRPVKLEDFVVFCRQFATMIRSGIQIDQSLEIMEDQTTSKNLKLALGDVSEQVLGGQQLSKAMSEHPKIFPEMFVNMVASGESGGNLDDVLDRMANHYEKEYKTIQKIKSAMTYPIIVLVLAVAVVIFLLLKIVPTFAGMFEEQGAQLPWITRFVMGASNAIVGYWWALLLAVVAIVIGWKAFASNDEGKLAIDKAKFRMPMFGIIFKKASIARLARTLSSLYMSGVPLLQSIDITVKVVGNRVMENVLLSAKDSLAQGKQLSDPFAGSGLFPKMVVSMLIVGEETGQIDKMLLKIAEFLENDVDQSVDRLKAVIEPLMMLIVASIVGVIVAAIMSPMFSIYDTFLQ
ncbi:type II secretion system F family protein [Paenibacillaceae bacterium WGS1546]|uniref:type II secretion system F family protein n=1 Tax=Cohnella sp. WGS1546 TaxID=3366810 RepID=UPI00372CF2DC